MKRRKKKLRKNFKERAVVEISFLQFILLNDFQLISDSRDDETAISTVKWWKSEKRLVGVGGFRVLDQQLAVEYWEIMETVEGIDEKDYVLLKDLRVELKDATKEEANVHFSFCFWLYLRSDGLSLPCTILHQEHTDRKSHVPFLLLNERNKMVLFPVLLLHEDATIVTSTSDFMMNTWVHIGCEVSQNALVLHINGEVVGEKSLPPLNNNFSSGVMEKFLLPCIIGDNQGCQAFVHCVEVLPFSFTMKNFYTKDPPLQLSIDNSSLSDIEVDSDGAWSIVGGKVVQATVLCFPSTDIIVTTQTSTCIYALMHTKFIVLRLNLHFNYSPALA